MLRSDLMLESACPELSPLMNRPESACCSRCKRGRGGTDNNNDNESDEEVKAMAESETKALAKAKAREEGGAKGEKCAAKGQKGNIERNVSTSSAYCCWKQVEINTIASGFGHLGPASKTIQRCLLSLSHCLSHSISIYTYTYTYLSIFLTYEYICKKIYTYILRYLHIETNRIACTCLTKAIPTHTHTHSHTHTYRLNNTYTRGQQHMLK